MRKYFLGLVLFLVCNTIDAQSYKLQSPDGHLKLSIYIEEQLRWDLSYDENTLIENGDFSLMLNNEMLFKDKVKPLKAVQSNKKELIESVVPVKFKQLQTEYNMLLLHFRNKVSLEFRLYNEGLAYRLVLGQKETLIVGSEDINITFPERCEVYFPKEDKLQSHYERMYIHSRLDSIKENSFASLPLLVKTKEGINILITDADLYDYPNMFLQKGEGNTLKSLFPKAVLEARAADRGADRNEVITKEAAYIANTQGSRPLPWRVFAIAKEDKQLLENQMVFNLSRKEERDFSWVKPGKVAWDWWNNNNIYGVDFKSGINTETYKYYIDFASDFGLEYIILDEGWSASTVDILNCNNDIDVPALVEYGKSRNVKVILWVLWKPLYENIDKVLSLYQQWGVAGVKVDFMQRADQQMVNIYHDIASKAADYKMLVDFHGAFKPSGLSRAFPNVLSYEGVKGLENTKWSKLITPGHDLTLPFIRMVAGSMDYTPGAMVNRQEENYWISWSQPMSMGTRAHQVAMYIAYESPLQMLADNPSNYRKEAETTRFISKLPVVFDETFAIDACIGDYLVIARKKGSQWFLAGLNGAEERDVEIELSFLKQLNWNAEIFMDGLNANTHAEDYRLVNKRIGNEETLKVKMAKGGGFVVIFSPIE